MKFKKILLIATTVAVIMTVVLAAGCTSTQSTTTATPVAQAAQNSALNGYTATDTISDTPLGNKLATEKAVSDAISDLQAQVTSLQQQLSNSNISGLNFDKNDYGKYLKVGSDGKLTLGNVSSGGSSTRYIEADTKWGDITGDLSKQDDLQKVLDDKVSQKDRKEMIEKIQSMLSTKQDKIVLNEAKNGDLLAVQISTDGASIVPTKSQMLNEDEETGKVTVNSSALPDDVFDKKEEENKVTVTVKPDALPLYVHDIRLESKSPTTKENRVYFRILNNSAEELETYDDLYKSLGGDGENDKYRIASGILHDTASSYAHLVYIIDSVDVTGASKKLYLNVGKFNLATTEFGTSNIELFKDEEGGIEGYYIKDIVTKL